MIDTQVAAADRNDTCELVPAREVASNRNEQDLIPHDEAGGTLSRNYSLPGQGVPPKPRPHGVGIAAGERTVSAGAEQRRFSNCTRSLCPISARSDQCHVVGRVHLDRVETSSLVRIGRLFE